eukprot:tig00000459_g1112.t1
MYRSGGGAPRQTLQPVYQRAREEDEEDYYGDEVYEEEYAPAEEPRAERRRARVEQEWHPNRTEEATDALGLRWSEIAALGSLPSPRYGHSAVALGDSQMLVFGGWGFDMLSNGEGHLSDLYLLPTDTMKWERIAASGPTPPARYGHAAVMVDAKHMLVFGGWGAGPLLNDAWLLDVESMRWAPLKVRGRPPSGRAHHTATLHGSRVYVIGGYDGQTYLDDVWFLDLAAYEWRKVRTTGEQFPARAGHSATPISSHEILIYGGWNGSAADRAALDCAFVFDTEAYRFAAEVADGQVPRPRARHTATAAAWGGPLTLVVYGGRDTARGNTACLDDVTVLDADVMSWVAPRVHGRAPRARYAHTAVLLDGGSRVVVFGGWASGAYLNDLHALSFGAAAALPAPAAAPVARGRSPSPGPRTAAAGPLGGDRRARLQADVQREAIARVDQGFVLDKIRQLEDEKAELERVFEAYRELLERSKADQEELRQKGERQSESIRRLKDEIRKVRDASERRGDREKEEAGRLEGELDAQQRVCEALKERVREEQARRTEAEMELQAAAKLHERLREELRRLQAQQAALHERVRQSDLDGDAAAEQLNGLAGQNAGLMRQLELMQGEVDEQGARAVDLAAQLEASRDRVRALERQLERERAAGYGVQERLAREAGEVEDLRKSLDAQLNARRRLMSTIDRYAHSVLPRAHQAANVAKARADRIAAQMSQSEVLRLKLENERLRQRGARAASAAPRPSPAPAPPRRAPGLLLPEAAPAAAPMPPPAPAAADAYGYAAPVGPPLPAAQFAGHGAGHGHGGCPCCAADGVQVGPGWRAV